MEKKGKYYSLINRDSQQNENEASINDSTNTDLSNIKSKEPLITVENRNQTNEKKVLVQKIGIKY